MHFFIFSYYKWAKQILYYCRFRQPYYCRFRQPYYCRFWQPYYWVAQILGLVLLIFCIMEEIGHIRCNGTFYETWETILCTGKVSAKPALLIRADLLHILSCILAFLSFQLSKRCKRAQVTQVHNSSACKNLPNIIQVPKSPKCINCSYV